MHHFGLLIAIPVFLCRLVDPSDPSKIFLTHPVGEEDRLPEAPVYASNFGQDEVRLCLDV